MKTPKRLRSTACLAFVLLALATSSPGDMKNFAFHGVVTYLDDPQFLLDATVTNGAPIEGFYVFDSDVPAPAPEADVGDYWYTNSACGMVVKIGAYVFRTNPRHVNFLIELVNRPGQDNYLLRSYNNLCSQPLYVDHIAWQLDDGSGTALSDVALPLTPPDLGNFTSVFGLTVTGDKMPYFIRGEIQSIEESPAVIPETPGTTVGSAVEVSWPSRLGYFYQVQKSTDLENWSDVADPVLGDGSVLSMFFAKDVNLQEYYRAEIANFSK